MSGNRFQTTLICTSVVLFFFLLLEGACRLALHFLADASQEVVQDKKDFMDLQNFQVGQYAQKDDLLGYSLTPGKMVGEYSINSLGFRGRDFTPDKAPGTVRVICVGGSTTIGSNAGGDAFAYPAILEEILRKVFPRAQNIEVINAGVFGYHSWHSLIRVENEFDRLDPDCYIFMDGLNDVMAAYGMSKKQLESLGNGPNAAPLSQLVNADQESFVRSISGFMRESALYSAMEKAIRSLRGRLESLTFFWEMTEKMRLFGYKANVERAISHALARNKAVILLNYPWIVDGKLQGEKECARLPYKIDPSLIKVYNFGREYLRQVNADIAKELGVPCVDLQEVFDRQVEEWGLKRLYSDNLHFTRYGNYVLAKAVYRELGADRAFTRLAWPQAAPEAKTDDLDPLFPDLASWHPAQADVACLGKELVAWFGTCPRREMVQVSGLDENEVDTEGKWRWAQGGKVELRFRETAGRRMRVEFSFNNPIPGQGMTVLANGGEVFRMKDLSAQKWLVEKTEGSCELTTVEGENRVEILFAKGNHQGFDFAPGDKRALNGVFLHLAVQDR